MHIAYGEGIVVAVLLPFVFLFFELITLLETLFLVFLLFGVWTIIASFVLAKIEEKNFFLSWGIILSCASTIFVIPVTFAIGLIIIAIIASVFLYVSTRKSAVGITTQGH